MLPSLSWHSGNVDDETDALPLLQRLRRRGGNRNGADGALPSLQRRGRDGNGALPSFLRRCGDVDGATDALPCSGGSRYVAAMRTAPTARSLRSGGSSGAAATGTAAKSATGTV